MDDILYGQKNKIEATIRTAWKDRLAVTLGIGLGQMQPKGSFSRTWEPLLINLRKGSILTINAVKGPVLIHLF